MIKNEIFEYGSSFLFIKLNFFKIIVLSLATDSYCCNPIDMGYIFLHTLSNLNCSVVTNILQDNFQQKNSKKEIIFFNTTSSVAVHKYLCIRDKIKNPGKLTVLLNQILT